jgi:hypothetical protein
VAAKGPQFIPLVALAAALDAAAAGRLSAKGIADANREVLNLFVMSLSLRRCPAVNGYLDPL